MNLERVTWAAMSGAVLAVFWPWLVVDRLMTLSRGAADCPEEEK